MFYSAVLAFSIAFGGASSVLFTYGAGGVSHRQPDVAALFIVKATGAAVFASVTAVALHRRRRAA